MNSYELIYPHSIQKPILLSINDIETFYSLDHNRRQSEETEEIIQRVKTNLVNDNPNIYPGTKFRLGNARQHDGVLELQIGMTDYVDHLATNHDQQTSHRLIDLGWAQYGDPDAFLSNAIGNLAIVSTTDKHIALLKRSATVATFHGYYDCPGGHPEPDHISSGLNSQSIRTEFFDSISREITEELNVDQSDLSSISLLGLIRNLDDGRKPEMIFYVPTCLRSAELRKKYEKGEQTRWEADDLLMTRAEEASSSVLLLTTPARLAIDLYMNLENQSNEYISKNQGF